MDRRITAKFYEVVFKDGGRDLETMIRRIARIDGKRDREKTLGDDLALRLEHFEEREGLLLGDLTRIQTQNLPTQVMDENTDLLPIDELGHSIAFCYDPVAEVIAVQYHLQAQVSKVLSYFSSFEQNSEFSPLAMLKEVSVEDLREANIRKFSVRVAGIQDFRNSSDGDADGPIEQALSNIDSQYDAHSIEIIVTTRASAGSLDRNAVTGFLNKMIGRTEQTDTIQKLQAETFEGADPLDFLANPIRERETLDLPENDPVENRVRRLNYMFGAYDRNLTYIRRIRGVAED